jgi:molybdopterin/thiamine biosynthesis adenylyltransferase
MLPSAAVPPDFESDRVARQLLIWGIEGQAKLAGAAITVIGVGGTGSHIVQQLSHLGVGRLLMLDPDTVEETNLSRLVGATPADIGRYKVDVAASLARSVNPDTTVAAWPASVLEIDPSALGGSDVIMSCTDGHGSRALLTELAQQYLVPIIDLGVEVQPGASASRAGGGVRVLMPGGACLHCMGVLDPALVREEFLTESERALERDRGYLRGADDPSPSVIALNGLVASLAVMEVLDLLLGLFELGAQRVIYRAEARSVRRVSAPSRDGCYVCGEHGILGVGDARTLPRRPNGQPRIESG